MMTTITAVEPDEPRALDWPALVPAHRAALEEDDELFDDDIEESDEEEDGLDEDLDEDLDDEDLDTDDEELEL